MFSTVTTWICGRLIEANRVKAKSYIAVCVVVNLSILFTFKYLNFAAGAVRDVMALCGMNMFVPRFALLLPVGISFYTFQAIGYIIDVYREKDAAEHNMLTYALFVSFFPQLVAGPIERAGNLLRQFHERHNFESEFVLSGVKLMIWGYFMKLCVAENVSSYVDAVFNNLPYHTGTSVLVASFFFTFQIFCDFGGYSLIAIGAAKCMGFTLMQNFNHPYLSTSMRDFWRRWHISLSSWFTEYVYIPLGGNRCSKTRHMANTLVTMLVSGLWHGANWTFVLWGGYHGVLMVIQSLFSKRGKTCDKDINTLCGMFARCAQSVGCFVLVLVGWIFFRANNLSDLELAFHKILYEQGSMFNGEGMPSIIMSLMLIGVLMLKEIKDEMRLTVHLMHSDNIYISAVSSGLMVVVILLCAQFSGAQFIYFQF